jgi:hypothetical protein
MTVFGGRFIAGWRHRSLFAVHWLAHALAAAVAFTMPTSAAEPTAKPNIVYILADDLDYNTDKSVQKWLENRNIMPNTDFSDHRELL